MGLYVKGLEMPKVCAECPFREVRYDPGYYNYEHCKALGRIFNESKLDIDPFEEKFSDCPLIEIPTPHGRLIEEHYSGELKAKQPEGVFIIYRSADEDNDRFILEAEE